MEVNPLEIIMQGLDNIERHREAWVSNPWILEWECLLLEMDSKGIEMVIQGLSVWDANMRRNSPLAGALTQSERVEALRNANVI